jgi:hypothetical protein
MSTGNEAEARGETTSAETPHRTDIDWSRRDPVSLAVLRAVGDVEGRDPADLPPLAGAVDPDAIEAFFADDPAEMTDRHLGFAYAGHDVRVDGAGHVFVD